MENMKSLMPSALPQKLTDVKGGSYAAWNATVFPHLAQAKVSAGLLLIRPRGFVLPHYADSSKIGYVMEGSDGSVALIFPETKEEKVVELKKGVAIVVPIGSTSWWFNSGNQDIKIIFLGETSNATTPSDFTYALLSGSMGILKGFSPIITSKAYSINQEQVNELTHTQKQPLITTIEEGKILPKPCRFDSHKLSFNFEESSPQIHVEKGGSVKIMTSEKHHPLVGIELSGEVLKLEPNAMFGPSYYAEKSGVKLTYVIKGSGWVQVVDMNGQNVLDSQLESGNLFVVPKFCVVAIAAGEEGIQCFSIVTTSRPLLGQLAGKTSVWKSLDSEALQATLNLSPKLYEQFIDNLNKTTIIIPPKLGAP